MSGQKPPSMRSTHVWSVVDGGRLCGDRHHNQSVPGAGITDDVEPWPWILRLVLVNIPDSNKYDMSHSNKSPCEIYTCSSRWTHLVNRSKPCTTFQTSFTALFNNIWSWINKTLGVLTFLGHWVYYVNVHNILNSNDFSLWNLLWLHFACMLHRLTDMLNAVSFYFLNVPCFYNYYCNCCVYSHWSTMMMSWWRWCTMRSNWVCADWSESSVFAFALCIF